VAQTLGFIRNQELPRNNYSRQIINIVAAYLNFTSAEDFTVLDGKPIQKKTLSKKSQENGSCFAAQCQIWNIPTPIMVAFPLLRKSRK